MGCIKIKKLVFCFTLCCFVFLIGCSKETTKQNNVNPFQYLESFGWHIEEKISEGTLDTKKILDGDARIAGVDFKPYKEVYLTTYLLKEKQKTGKKIYASTYQVNVDIIGGIGSLEGWEPGTFSLKDKERLINEGKINK